MARFDRDPNRLNYTLTQSGKEYNLRLARRSQATFTTLINLLPSTYISSVQGPNYTVALKAVAVEIAKIELALEDVAGDGSFETTRTEFIYSIIGYLVFLSGRLPDTAFDDVEFKRFLLSVIKIYFQGSIPTSLREGVSLFVSESVTVYENFLLVRQGASGLDISDQFGFQIDIEGQGGAGLPPDLFLVDRNIRLVLDILRPAHTLYRIRYIFRDTFDPPNDTTDSIVDSMRWRMSAYYYEEFRVYPDGLRDRDRGGVRTNRMVQGENHSGDF